LHRCLFSDDGTFTNDQYQGGDTSMKLNERTIIGVLVVVMFAVWFWQIRAHYDDARDYVRADNVKPMIDQLEDLQQQVNEVERKMVDLETK
jgi:hypothetical protein